MRARSSGARTWESCTGPARDRRASVCHVLPGVPHQSHAPIIDHRFERISIYRGAFGLKGELRGLWCTNGSRKPISSRVIPEQSAPPDAPAPRPAPAPLCTRRGDCGLRPGVTAISRPTRHGSSMNQTLVWVSDVSWSVMIWDGDERLSLAPTARRLSVVSMECRRERIHR